MDYKEIGSNWDFALVILHSCHQQPFAADADKPWSMPVDLNGYWKMVSNDNFDDYMKALGEKSLKTHRIQHISNYQNLKYQIIKENVWNLSFFFLWPGVNAAIRTIASLLKTDKDIVQDGDHFQIKTLSTFKNYHMDFHVGQEFEEDLSGVDNRKCMVRIGDAAEEPIDYSLFFGQASGKSTERSRVKVTTKTEYGAEYWIGSQIIWIWSPFCDFRKADYR